MHADMIPSAPANGWIPHEGPAYETGVLDAGSMPECLNTSVNIDLSLAVN